MSAIDLVVFDLWKTLVPLTDQTKELAFVQTSAALGEDPEALRPHWASSRVRRETTDLREYLVELGTTIGRVWSTADVTRAMHVRREHHVVGFRRPLPDAIPCLQSIRGAGLKVAVVSNGSSDVPHMLAESPLAAYIDHLVVSGTFGQMKPAPAIYADVSRALDIPLTSSMYIGDGQDTELEGARDAGCRAVLVNRGSTTSWSGASIPDLHAVADLLASSSSERP